MEAIKKISSRNSKQYIFETPDILSEGVSALSRDAHSKSKKILVVDDEAINRMVAKSLLEDLGYEVDLADCGVKGLAMYHHHYCAVILDIGMPDMKGYEVCQKIRMLEKAGRRIPIIAATAFDLKEVQEECLLSGMDEVLSKPLVFEKLKDTLEKHVHFHVSGA